MQIKSLVFSVWPPPGKQSARRCLKVWRSLAKKNVCNGSRTRLRYWRRCNKKTLKVLETLRVFFCLNIPRFIRHANNARCEFTEHIHKIMLRGDNLFDWLI